MLRAIAIVTTIAVTVASLGSFARGYDAHTAHACSYIGQSTADLAVRARFVVVADAVAVGGDPNTQPTLTATSFPTHEFTSTPTPSTTRESFLDFSTPSNTPVPVVTPVFNQGFPGLQGTGATLRVVETIDGTAPAELAIDAERRAALERELREREARVRPISSCGPFSPPQYEVGVRYLVLVGASFPDAIPGSTIQRWRVDGTDVLIGSGEGSISMMRAQHARYFPNIPLHPQTRPEDTGVSLVVERVPLDQFVRFVKGVRGASIVTPPETGSAGLAAGR